MASPADLVPPLAFAGWASDAGIACAGGPADSFWRAASISKIVTGQTVAAVAEDYRYPSDQSGRQGCPCH